MTKQKTAGAEPGKKPVVFNADSFTIEEIIAAAHKIGMAADRAELVRRSKSASYEDLASEAGLPVGTIKSRIARGRRLLAPVIEAARVEATTADLDKHRR